MKIAYVLGDRGIPVFGTKGASIHVREIVNAFAKLGHEVTLFTLRKGPQKSDLNCEIIEITTSTQLVNTSVQKVTDKVKLKELNLIKLNQILYEKLLSTHQSTPFDLIYERYSLFGTAGIKAAKDLNLPVVMEVNSPLIEEQLKYRELFHLQEVQGIEQQVFDEATIISAVSDEIKQYICSKQSTVINNTHVIPNAVNTETFHPAVLPSFIPAQQDTKVIGFVGSLKPWHGIEVLLDAFQDLLSKQTNCHLLIVGDGPLNDWIKGYICGSKMESSVTITGWTVHQDLPGLIKSMDIAVAPYPELEHFYFSPLKLYEYMAIGTPVVASRIGQIQKIIQHNENGMLVEPGNVEELSSSLQKILNDTNKLNRLGLAANQSTINLTWTNNAKQVVQLACQATNSSGL